MKALNSLLVVFFLIGCSSNPAKFQESSDELKAPVISAKLNDDLIVQNLVFAISQIPDTHPLRTTVSVKPATTTLANIVEARFNDAGYGIQYVDSDEGQYYASHAAQNSITENGEKTTYMVAIGSITVERDYTVSRGKTHPNSIMRIDGTPEQDIVLNDDVFGEEFMDSQYKEVYFELGAQPVVASVNVESVQLPVVEQSFTEPAADEPKSFGGLVKQNMREIMRSNFASLFDEYDVVDQAVLVFPNDSLRIGNKNKSTVTQYVKNFNPETDIMSVIGCSHGRTSTGDGGKGGNQLLALGRANRVKEALIFSGVDQAQIYEEGCWDDEYFDEVMPRRGVVLTHKRLIGNG